MEISVNKTNLLNTSKNLIQLSNVFRNEIMKMDIQITNLSKCWEGSDASKYIKLLKGTYLPNLMELSKTIGEYGNYLKHTEEAYELLDDTFSSKKIEV